MLATQDRPPAGHISGFLLGTLPPDENEWVASWVESDPEAPAALDAASDDDPLLRALAAGRPVDWEVPDESLLRRVVGTLTTLGEDGRAAAHSDAPLPERVGGYRVVRVLGKGGMGTVYEAADERLGRRVAVKVLNGDLAGGPEHHGRFFREARAAAALRSDHVVTVYQVGEEDGCPFLAMEYLQGSTLEDWLRARPTPPPLTDFLRLARELLLGLAAAHEAGLVHRDIKPPNLWVEAGTGRVKVLDFGLARPANGPADLTRLGAVVGTPAYMAPEQADGRAVDARCDLFAVGAVLFRMATGASPFQRGSVTATLSALANFDPPAPETLPAPLARFVRRLLARDPAHRPADARAALAELDEAAREFRGRSLWRLAPVAGLAVLVAAALPAIVVTVRDRTGRPVEVLRVPPGGSVTVTETPPATQPGTAKAEPTRKDRTVGAGVRVRVTRNTLGYTDSTTDTLSQILSAGTRGTVLEVSADTNRCRIRAEQDKPPVWVSLDLVEIE